jgi:hypothetical protein
LEEYRAGQRNGATSHNRDVTLDEWLQYWLQHVIKPKREPTTYENYEILVRLHIVPYFGRIRLSKLMTEDVEAWLEHLEQRRAGLRTRQSALIRLRTALNVPLARHRISGNPAEHVEARKRVGGRRGSLRMQWKRSVQQLEQCVAPSTKALVHPGSELPQSIKGSPVDHADPTGQNRPTFRNRAYPPCGVKS